MKVIYHFNFLKDIVATEDKRIFNKRTNRYLKKTYCGGSVGFWINRQFKTWEYLFSHRQKVEPYFINKKEYHLPF